MNRRTRSIFAKKFGVSWCWLSFCAAGGGGRLGAKHFDQAISENLDARREPNGQLDE